MNIVEIVVSWLAPHTCIACKRESLPVCPDCWQLYLPVPPSLCYRCGAASHQYAVCTPCRSHTPLQHVWVGTKYAGVAKDTIALLKFKRAKEAAEVAAECLNLRLPMLPIDIIVTAAPTASSRVRQRGYDQAKLIGTSFALKRRLEYRETLWRIKTTRQVGANRSDRFKYLENAFIVRQPKRFLGRHILLIDDVLTTGATLESAARELMANGAGQVDAAVFAT